jgi:hypothetical protein
VRCYKNLLAEELRKLAADGDLPLLEKLKAIPRKPQGWDERECVPSPPVTVRVPDKGFEFSAPHLNVKYSTRAVVVELFVLETAIPLEDLAGKEVEVVKA